MQYPQHNFYSNFQGSVNSGDVEFTLNLWVNEISDIIVSETKKIVDLLNKTNVPANVRAKFEEE